MVPQNPNWVRWIRASVNQHFHTIVQPSGLMLLFEGTDRRTEDQRDASELRLDGPKINEISKGYWRFDIVIDVLIKSALSDQNIYTIERDQGNVLAAFTTSISVFKYGDGIDDDQTYLGCLVLCPDYGEAIIVTNFGQVQNEVRVRQSTVEATYRMELIA